MSTLDLVLIVGLAILANYRLARMVALEDGPFDIFATLRRLLDPEQKTWIGRGINCPLCVGFWGAALLAALVASINGGELDAASHAAWVVLLWLAIAGGQTALQKITER